MKVGKLPKELTFGQVEAVLARIHSIADHKRVAFAGRLKFLQKHKVPARMTAGRGRPGSFTLDNLMQMAVAVELLNVGLPPQTAAESVRSQWWLRWEELYDALVTLRDARAEDDSAVPPLPWTWVVRVRGLADMSKKINDRKTFSVFQAVGAAKFQAVLHRGRSIIISPMRLVSELSRELEHFGFATLEDLIQELDDQEADLVGTLPMFRQWTKRDAVTGRHLDADTIKGIMRDVAEKAPKFHVLPKPEQNRIFRRLAHIMDIDGQQILSAARNGEGVSMDPRYLGEFKAMAAAILHNLQLIAEAPGAEEAWKPKLTDFGRSFCAAYFEEGTFNVDPQA